jgi:hypothetical protein
VYPGFRFDNEEQQLNMWVTAAAPAATAAAALSYDALQWPSDTCTLRAFRCLRNSSPLSASQLRVTRATESGVVPP